jgi:hypothetical protein
MRKPSLPHEGLEVFPVKEKAFFHIDHIGAVCHIFNLIVKPDARPAIRAEISRNRYQLEVETTLF